MFASEKKVLFTGWMALILVFTACVLLFFAHLERGKLASESEGNYAEIPREMLESGDWVIPHLNYVPYLEKPPLFYWLTALTYKAIGVNAFAARAWSALPALLLVMSIFFFVRRVRGAEEALLSALMLAASVGMIAMARISYMDMLLCLFTACTFLCFYAGSTASSNSCHSEGKARRISPRTYFLLLFVSLALAVLTKGLIGIVLPCGGIFLFLLLQKRWSILKHVPWVSGTFLFLAIAVPWHVLADMRNDRFTWFYFINEHWLRFLGTRMPKDYYAGPFYYQFLRLLFLFLPWSPLLPFVVLRKYRERSNEPDSGGYYHPEERSDEGSSLPKKILRFAQDDITERMRDPWTCFLFCWIAAFLLFYSISKAKANYYMMPALPPLAMLLASGLRRQVWERWKGRVWQGLMGLYLLAALIVYGLLVFYPHPLLKKLAPGAFPYLFAAIFALAACLLGSLILARRKRWLSSFGLFVAAITLSCACLFAHEQIFERRGSIQPLLHLIQANEDPETMVVLRGPYERESALAFYRGKRCTIVSDQGDVGGDLDFGARFPENRQYFIQWSDFLRRFGGQEKLLYVTSRDSDYGELSGNHPQKCRLVASIANRLLIANYPSKPK